MATPAKAVGREEMSAGTPSDKPPLRRVEWIAGGVFLAANLFVPLLFGDIFPFTSSPMFRDAPRAYCIYRAFGPDGEELKADSLLLQRIYDGNPPGYGVGIAPPATLARFGEIATEEEIREHVLRSLAESKQAFVTIERDVIACVDGVCKVRESHRFRVERTSP